MRFLHLGDLHLGKTLNEFDLIEDQRFLLEQILSMTEKYQVDGILLAGDVYDRAIPPEEAVELLDYFLRELAQRNIKTFLISGNHDSDERLNFGSSLFEARGIYIAGKYTGELKKISCRDEFGEINIYLLPFVKASQVRHFYPEEEILSYDAAVRTIISHAGVDPETRNIILSHQFVTGSGAADPEMAGSERNYVQSVGMVEKIGYDCYAAFDYAALGHIHSPQQAGRETVRYSGSLMKYSISEAGREKSVPLVTLGKKGEVSVELLPLVPKRNLRHLKGKVSRLLSPENVEDPEDFIYATLTDEEVIPDVMNRFRQYYPNIIKIDYEQYKSESFDAEEFVNSTKEKSFPELIGEFYQHAYGTEISEEEMKLMKEAGVEAGVVYEAD